MKQLLIPYPGSKFMSGRRLAEFYPQHDTFIAPFGGAAGEFANKPRSKTEVWNDVDPYLVAVMRCLQDSKKRTRLRDKLRRAEITRDYHDDAHRALFSKKDDVGRAWAFIVCCWLGYNGRHPANRGKWYGGDPDRKKWTDRRRKIKNLPAILDWWAGRMKNVRVENRDYQELFDEYDGRGVLWFLDPPYVPERCGRDPLYQFHIDHVKFLRRVVRLKGKVLLCGYYDERYNLFLSRWRCVNWERMLHQSHTRRSVREFCWMNFGDDGKRIAPNWKLIRRMRALVA